MKPQLCAICGKKPATTRDHIPPKGIFSTPRPGDLITVPACFPCNNNANVHDEAFRTYLSLHVGTDTDETTKLWKQHASRSVQRNPRLKAQIVATMRDTDVYTKGGIYLRSETIATWDSDAHDAIIERTIRGLYYHHFNDILANKVRIRVHWLKRIPKEIYEMSLEWPGNNIGDTAFIYKYGRAEDNELLSVWVMQFYEKHFASGYTEPKDDLSS